MKVRIVWTPKGGRPSPGNRSNANLRSEVRIDAPPRALVDIHSHILWGLDGGSRDLSQSLTMLGMAYAHGTTDIVATPQANDQHNFDPAVVGERMARLAALGPALPRIHRGCDLYLSARNVEDALASPHKYTINGLSYLITEFPDTMSFSEAEETLLRLMGVGIIPIITHPECNPLLQNSPAHLEQLVSMGCVLQVTAQSLTGGFGKQTQETALRLVAEGLVHVIASDAHDIVHRPPPLDLAWKVVRQQMGDAVATNLFINNPSAVIMGQTLPAMQEKPARAQPAHSSDRYRTQAVGFLDSRY
jgi:protein-tyrosine phosphatase